MMDRRDAMKALAALASASGLGVSPVQKGDATETEIVVFSSAQPMSVDAKARLTAAWAEAVRGTALEGKLAMVLDSGVRLQFVKGLELPGLGDA